MGQKINPTGLRIGVIKDWESRWYAKKGEFGNNLVEDNMIREYLVNANVKADKLRAISYGKDKPAVEGNSEEAWGKNRRGMLLPARKKADK